MNAQKHLFRLFLALALLLGQQCRPTASKDYLEKANNPAYYHAGVRRLIDIIRHDIFAPTIASRIYAYASIAGYEAMVPGFPEYRSLSGQIKTLTPPPAPEAGQMYCYPLAGVTALLTTGKALIFSEEEMEGLKKEALDEFRRLNMPEDVFNRSVAYGEAVSKHIMAWSKGDNYAQTRSAPKFTIDTHDPGRWEPTPPNYDVALEPHWGTIRPWVIDSAKQFRPVPPVPFSQQKGSPFYQLALEVYNIRKNLTPEQEATAWYWDDNPFATQISGHFTYSVKKISPAGHWMNITRLVARESKADIMRSAEAYAKVACAIADAFISCWDEKFRSAVIRPETYINRYIVDKKKDEIWRPLIQTPPFPEHTSGHSTISSAAAAALTQMFGENYAFTDSTEVQFGMPARTFPSFQAASEEVGMSRLYGGIHYNHGNVEGLKSGKALGTYVAQKLQTRANK